MKRRLVIGVFCLLAGFMHQAYAEKVAYVDAKTLIDSSPQGGQETRKLEEEFGERNRELRAQIELFRSQKTELEKNALLMSSDEVESKTRELRDFQRSLERAQQEYNEDYAASRNAGLARLEKFISEVIINIAKEQEIDLVLQQVVYASNRIDLTGRILEELEKEELVNRYQGNLVQN